MRIDAIVFDCEDAAPLARFWAAALGWHVAAYDAAEIERLAAKGIEDPEDDPNVMVEPPEDEPPGLPVLFFTEVPERGSDVRPSIVDECLACHLSRQVPKLVAPALLPAATPAILTDLAATSPAPPNRIVPSPRVTRGPPTPTV